MFLGNFNYQTGETVTDPLSDVCDKHFVMLLLPYWSVISYITPRVIIKLKKSLNNYHIKWFLLTPKIYKNVN